MGFYRWQDYVYPGTDTLRNELGVTDSRELGDDERTLSNMRTVLGSEAIPRTFDFDHLKTIHLNLFQDLYEWAGQPRTVEIYKGNGFCRAEHIESFANNIFGRLAQDNHLRGLGQEEFIQKAADYLGDINALHPFRDGNGRAQREFMNQLAEQAGYWMDWSRVDPERNVAASRESFDGRPELMRQLMTEIVAPLPDKEQSRTTEPEQLADEHDTGFDPLSLYDVADGSRDRSVGDDDRDHTR